MAAAMQHVTRGFLRMVGLGPPRAPAVQRPPLVLWAPALLVAVAMALPLAYLVERALGGGGAGGGEKDGDRGGHGGADTGGVRQSHTLFVSGLGRLRGVLRGGAGYV